MSTPPTYGARGTSALDLNRVPSRKMRGRVQLYRRRKPRPLGPTLEAMLRGGPVYFRNPQDFARERQREFKRLYGRGKVR